MLLFEATVLDDNEEPVSGIRVVLVCRIGDQLVQFENISDHNGVVSIEYEGTANSVHLKSTDYWTTELHLPESGNTIPTTRVDTSGGPLGWWHTEMKFDQYDPEAGRGIRVGVIDTGLGEHESLNHVHYYEMKLKGGVWNVVPGQRAPDEHGIAVCGLIGARPPLDQHHQHRAGMAPGVELHCIGAAEMVEEKLVMNETKVAEALRFLCEEKRCDLINLSLAAEPRVAATNLREHVRTAFDAGCLIISAAGNCGELEGSRKSNVCAPAKFPWAIAVSALGKDGVGPACHPSPFKSRSDHRSWGVRGLYVADFSSRGAEIFCSAPGVTVIAPIDNRHAELDYAYFEGTSFSSPIVCGALAARLSKDPAYGTLMGRKKAQRAKSVLRSICEDIADDRQLFGHGLPIQR